MDKIKESVIIPAHSNKPRFAHSPLSCPLRAVIAAASTLRTIERYRLSGWAQKDWLTRHRYVRPLFNFSDMISGTVQGIFCYFGSLL
jgi:hypothetical protein